MVVGQSGNKSSMEKNKKLIVPITKSEQHKRAERIRLLLADCDGVLTDNGVYYSDLGEEMKRYSIRDGMESLSCEMLE